MKILAKTIMVASAALLFLLIAVGNLVFADSHLQPVQHEIIDTFTPLGFNPGAVMAINGGPFEPQVGTSGSIVYLNGDPLPTFFDSISRIIFVVPLTTACGYHKVQVKTLSNAGAAEHVVESNLVEVFVGCLNLDFFLGPKPSIQEIIHSGHVTAGLESIYIEGFNILPTDPRDGFPHTIVHYEMGNNIGTERLTYQTFGRASFKLNVDQCGTYNVTFRNYYKDEHSFSESGRFKIEVTNGCDNVDAIGGTYGLELVDTNAFAEIGLPHEMTLKVDYNGAFAGLAELEIFVNGHLEGTQQLNISANQVQTFPVQLRFREAGTHTVEVRIGDATALAQVNAQGDSVPTGSPSDIQNFSGLLADFDSDADCIMGELEFFAFMDGWLAGIVDDVLFFEGVDAWVEQGNICIVVSANAGSLKIILKSNTAIFAASESPLSLAVRVFDLNGQAVFAEKTLQNKLSWNMRNRLGARVANGVYFVQITEQLTDGSVRNNIRKIALLN